jgi:16S rRNA (guanine527-N7)-methyltransferase
MPSRREGAERERGGLSAGEDACRVRSDKLYPPPVDARRIADLLSPFLGDARLSQCQLDQLATYLDLLLRWNARMNLTAVRDPEQIVTRHFGESLFAARALLHPEHSHGMAPSRALEPPPESTPAAPVSCGLPSDPRGEARMAPSRALEPPHESLLGAGRSCGLHINDVGSGAGFPGLPLKIYAPDARVTLIESQNKKQTFLREVIRALALTAIDVFPGRAEDLHTRAHLVTLRAVERFQRALPVAASLLQPGGRLALLIGSAQSAPARSLARHLRWSEPLAIPLSAARILLVGTYPAEHEPKQ